MSSADEASTSLPPVHERASGATEFRAGRKSTLVLILNLAMAAAACVVGALFMSASARNVLFLFMGAIALCQLIGFLIQRRYRLILTDEILRIEVGFYSQAVRWKDVHAAVFRKNFKHVILHLADGTTTGIAMGRFSAPGAVRKAIESHLGESVQVSEIRTDLAAGPIAAIVAAVGITGLAAVSIYYTLPPKPKPFMFLAFGFASGIALSMGLLLLGPAPLQKRYKISWVCLAIVVIVGALLTWPYPGKWLDAIRGAMVKAVLFVLGFGTGLVIPQAVARMRELNTETRKMIEPPQPFHHSPPDEVEDK